MPLPALESIRHGKMKIAEYDNIVKALTTAIVLGLPALNIWVGYKYATKFPASIAIFKMALVTSLILGIILLTYLFAPKGYEITLDGLLIKRPLRSFTIPSKEIVAVNKVEKISGGIRLWASGGLFGYFGLFKLSGLGRVWVYATNKNKLVLIKTKDKKYIISPKDPNGFLSKLRFN